MYVLVCVGGSEWVGVGGCICVWVLGYDNLGEHLHRLVLLCNPFSLR